MSAPATAVTFPGVTLFLPDGVMTGDLTYDARTSQLAITYADGETEVLSIDLTLEGYVAAPGEALIKDWSEHSGFTAALVDAGIVMRVETLQIGPFDSRAYRVLVLTEAVTGR
ncbi:MULTISPECIES: hypothetical protein [Micrococcus]|uniref:hypothetical protein n=1 Tax=Micrococcus TaxID=1269 RepID=UPI00098E9A0C|nr:MULTISPECIES: hypothetical protein [Micrococcus]MCV7456633.1 hypothetical protein [Micrococcus luteus]MCV7556766.1 hypothetical protein [Micrococcus luteus]QDW17717.1 hypothetical protein B1A86_00007465 [Micrococcus sp. KBS0714]